MRFREAAALYSLALALCLVAVSPRQSVGAENLAEELTRQKLLHYGMELPAALEMLEEEDNWDIAYRVSTPSTYDLACRYKEELYFQARFYLGRCYYIEKRLEIEEEQLDPIFSHFRDKLGETPEAAQSRDGKLLFSRWSSDDREVNLTGYRRESGRYMVTYEEFESEIIGLARRTQERELDDLPMEQDPVTGKQRPARGEGETSEER